MRAPALLLSCLLLLAACGDDEVDAARAQANSEVVKLRNLQAELQTTSNDVHQFLIANQNARICMVVEESAVFEAAFNQLAGPIDAKLKSADALGRDGVIDPSFKSAGEQVADLRSFIGNIDRQLEGAKRANTLLHDSTLHRKDFMKRATDAWYSLLNSSARSQAWFGRAAEFSDDRAKQTQADYQTMLGYISEAKRLYDGIQATFSGAEKGKPYMCSRWGLDVERLEILAEKIKALATKATSDWAPAGTQPAQP